MSAKRLSLALEEGEITLPPSGRILCLRARADSDLAYLPKDRCVVEQGFFPDYQFLQARGWECTVAANGEFSAAIVFLTRSKAESRFLIARALEVTAGGPVLVDGQKTDGVDGVLKDCRKHGANIGPVFSKSHGKLFAVFAKPEDFTPWLEADKHFVDARFHTRSGAFSAEAVDKGSAALVAALPSNLAGRVADLGAGWGYISWHVLQHPDVTECHLVEAENIALECARRNVLDPRAQFHWADATEFRAIRGFDNVVCNPPFHTGRAVDAELGRAFIRTAASILSPSGALWLVANRHLPYEETLDQAFGKVEEVAGDRSFKVFRAIKPRSRRNAALPTGRKR